MATDVELRSNPLSSWQLTDLIDVAALQSIQDTFAKVFGLPTVIIDRTGRNLTNITHRVRFCEDLTRTSLAGSRCTNCDLRAMDRATATNRPAIFECWNGLYDCAIPIAPKGQVLGYFLCGQILARTPDRDRFKNTAEEIGVDPSAYLDALGDVRMMSLEQYESSISTMHALAQMIADQAAASMDNLKVLQDALQAKTDTAKLVDELEVILEAFRDSFTQPDERSTLETIADQLQRLIPYDSCLIYTVEEQSDELVPRVVRDPNPEAFGAYRPRKGTGVWGSVAATGVRRKIDDVREDPDFEPIPGVDVEPEAMLVVPMIRKGMIFGVISLSRFDRRVFTEHELRILAVFCSHASLAVQVSRMHAESTRRLREEQALRELLEALGQGLPVEDTLTAIGRCGLDLLRAQSAILRCRAAPGAPSRLVRIAIDERDSENMLADAATELEGCVARHACRTLERGNGSLLLIPLEGGSEVLGTAVFVAPAGTQWDQSVAESFAKQSSLGLRNALARERERRVLVQNDLLSELGTALAHAKSLDDIRARLLSKTSDILGSELSVLALLDDSSDSIQAHVKEGRGIRQLSIKLAGRGHFASARLSRETAPEDSVFAAWSQDFAHQLSQQLGIASYIGAPLRAPSGVVGGLFVAWRTVIQRFSAEQQRLLELIGGTAGASIGNLLARAETDDSLRRRLAELQALARLAERITPLTEEAPILDEVLAAIQELAGLKGAVYAVKSRGRWTSVRASGLEPREIAELTTTLSGLKIQSQPTRHDIDGGTRQLLTVQIPGTDHDAAMIMGVGPARRDPQRDIVLAALVRFGSVALENARLHGRQRETIARLESANQDLRDVLSAHELLTTGVIEGQGIQSIADSLARLVGGEVLVLGARHVMLARAPVTSAIHWVPSGDEREPRTITEIDGDRYIVAAPAAVRDETFAWLVIQLENSPGQVERAALEYGALLVAIELLRERTALEVEHRLRGGFLEELFSGQFVEALILKQGMAFGFDLTRPARVFLIEPIDASFSQANAHVLYSIVAESASAWPGRHLVALEGSVVIVLMEEGTPADCDASGTLFELQLERALRRRMPSSSVNIGVSRLVHSLAEYGKAYAATRRGLDLVRLLGRSGQTISFRQMGVQELLLQADEPSTLLEFIIRYVEPLERYDAEHSSNLLHSLETFYDAGFNLQEAARRLAVHVSTLRYRLTRIEELLGVDPKTGDSRLNIEVAMKAARALAVHRH